jgi:hypothetical protein
VVRSDREDVLDISKVSGFGNRTDKWSEDIGEEPAFEER